MRKSHQLNFDILYIIYNLKIIIIFFNNCIIYKLHNINLDRKDLKNKLKLYLRSNVKDKKKLRSTSERFSSTFAVRYKRLVFDLACCHRAVRR